MHIILIFKKHKNHVYLYFDVYDVERDPCMHYAYLGKDSPNAIQSIKPICSGVLVAVYCP